MFIENVSNVPIDKFERLDRFLNASLQEINRTCFTCFVLEILIFLFYLIIVYLLFSVNK